VAFPKFCSSAWPFGFAVYTCLRQGRLFFWNTQTNATQWQARPRCFCFISTNHVGILTLLQRPPRPLPNIRESGGQAAAAAVVQVAPVPPRTYSEAAASLPAQSSQYWFSIYHLGKLWHLARLSGSLTSLVLLQRKCLSRKGTRALKVRCVHMALVSRAHLDTVAMSYEDLWEAFRANKFDMEATIEHLMTMQEISRMPQEE
jgi:hypothetical protein